MSISPNSSTLRWSVLENKYIEKTIDLQINSYGYKGLAIGLTIIITWGGQTVFLLNREVSGTFRYLIPVMFILQTFLYTGLFITTHDAMHGLVLPKHPALNNYIGCLAVLLYALFSYTKLNKKHQEHHKFPASDKDPDFHDGKHRSFLAWYVNFLSNYLSLTQIIGMAIIFNILKHVLGIPTANLLLFWVIPAISSTFQLFYFGTYLPHRELTSGYTDRHRARSNSYSAWLSFLTCYHFGYHWEHHAYPQIPWWQLSKIRKQLNLYN